MKLKEIAIDNLKRRKQKMVFLVMGMAIGIATMVTIFTITRAMQEDVRKKLDEFGANIIVLPRVNTLSMSYGGISIPGAQYEVGEIRMEDAGNIWGIKNSENLATVSPKLLGAVDVGPEKILIVGADLPTEIRLKMWWKFIDESRVSLTRTQEPSPLCPTKMTTVTRIEGLKNDDLIIGSSVAKRLNKRPAEKIRMNDQEFNVKGVLEETGSQDDSIIFMDLLKSQELLGKQGKITLIEVAALCTGCPVEEMARQINEAIPTGKATPIKQVVEQKMKTMNQLNRFGLAVGVIILLIGSLIVFVTMSSSVNERTREIGIFRAIGFRRMHIIKIILIEASILSLISGVAGYILGLAATSFAGPLIAGMERGIPFDPYLALFALGLALLTGTSATIYPALKASRIDPAEALRYI